jgi:hypothetical protein
MYVRRLTVTVTTDGDGDGTGYSDYFTGRVHAVEYVKDSSSPYASGVDFACTLDLSGKTVWTESDVNASKIVAPHREMVRTTDATTLDEPIYADGDRLKIVVDDGGDTKTGTFYVEVL